MTTSSVSFLVVVSSTSDNTTGSMNTSGSISGRVALQDNSGLQGCSYNSVFTGSGSNSGRVILQGRGRAFSCSDGSYLKGCVYHGAFKGSGSSRRRSTRAEVGHLCGDRSGVVR